MRLIASLVLIASTLALPAADGLNLDDLERAAQGNAGDAERWKARRDRMRADFAKVTALAERLTAEQRTQAWQRFLAAYAEKDPFASEDEDLRRQAKAALGVAPAAPVAEPGPPTDPARLERITAAYERAKRIDLLPSKLADKRHAWQDFISECSDDIPGTHADDEMRRWARLRLDGLAADPPSVMEMKLTIAPEFGLGEGTLISDVGEHGPAQRLGLHVGDTIIAAGQPPHDLVGDQLALAAYLFRLQRADDLRLVVLRGNMVIAAPASAACPVPRASVPARIGLQLGVHCLEASSTLTIGAVDAGQLAECAGLDAGDRLIAIHGTAATSVDTLEKTYRELPADVTLDLEILRAGVNYRLSVPAAGGAATWSVVDATAGWAPAAPQVAAAKP